MKNIKKFTLPELKLSLFFFILFASLLIFKELLYPQTEHQEKETLKHEVTVTMKLVQIYVIDKKGNPVTDLTKDEFELYDNGKPQQISYFEKHILPISEKKPQELKPVSLPVEERIPSSRMNRKFFLFFDFAFNNPAGILKSKRAALHFIESLHPTDEVGIISYSTTKGLTMHEYLTTDHERILKAVEGLGLKEYLGRAEKLEDIYSGDVERLAPKDVVGKEDEIIEEKMKIKREAERTVYKKQVSEFISTVEEFAKAICYIPYHKNIILFSSGVSNFVFYGGLADPTPLELSEAGYGNPILRGKYEKMIEELKRANCSIYAVNVEKERTRINPMNEAMRGDLSLRQLSKETGGKYFHNTMDPKKVVEDIQNLTSTYYVLGYPIDEKWDGKYHEIKVKVKRKECEVYGQRGYFNPKPFTEYTEFEKLLHLIDLALAERPQFQEPLRFSLTSLHCFEKGGANLLLISEVTKEVIKEFLGKKTEVIALVFDKEYNIIKMERAEVNFYSIPQNRIYLYTILSLPSGEYQLRMVIRDLETGRGGVASSLVIVPEIPDKRLRLYSPLLLIPEKNSIYLKTKKDSPSLSTIYPFDSGQYSPLVRELEQGTYKLLAFVRLSITGIPNPEIQLLSYLIHTSSGKKIPISLSVLNRIKERDTQAYLVELYTGELEPGRYTLYLFAEEINTKSRSHSMTTFTVK